METKKETTISYFIKGIIIFSAYVLLPTLISIFLKSFLPTNNTTTKTIFLLITQLIFCTAFFFIFKDKLINDFKDFKKNRKKYMNLIVKYWLYGLIVMMATNLIINLYINTGSLATNEELNRQALGEYPVYSILAVMFFAPFVEELVFRAAWEDAFKKIIPYAIFCGLLFGVLHISSGFSSVNDIFTNWKELLYLIPYGALGYALGYIYFKTNNIFSSITAHFMHNTLSLILILVSYLLPLLERVL